MDRETLEKLEAVCGPGAGESAEALSGRAIVIKSGGLIVGDADHGADLLDGVALARKAGLRPILVHGGAAQADAKMQEAGIVPKRVSGMRVTDAKTLAILIETFGELNAGIVESLRRRGVEARGFSGASNALVKAVRLDKFGDALQYVGRVDDVNVDLLSGTLESAIPVVSPLAPDASGQTYNVNADYMAAHLAMRGRVDMMILLTDVPGVLREPGVPATRIPELKKDEARRLIEEGVIGGGMAPKIDSMLDCLDSGVSQIHIIGGREPGALLRQLFADGGSGTRILP